jgi:hypothetical protein
LNIRVPSPSDFVVLALSRRVRSGQMEDQQSPDRSVGLRWDLELLPIEGKNNPRFANEDDYPVDKNNFAPTARRHLGARRRGHVGHPRRLGNFYQKTPFTFVTRVFVSGSSPTRSRSTSRRTTSTRARPLATCRPIRSWSTARRQSHAC